MERGVRGDERGKKAVKDGGKEGKKTKPKCEKRESEHSGGCADKGGGGKHFVVKWGLW